ncbi:hypothetical protein [Nonomuraea endophytica]|uniref:hypothetical protein n=1 Tax=Nonomuraea endophytica TaxID=714136 RepID=UPI0037C6785F
MNDPYRISPKNAPGKTSPAGRTATRAVLWLVLTVSAVVNVIANNILTGTAAIGIVAGIVAVGCITGLIISHVSGRRA